MFSHSLQLSLLNLGRSCVVSESARIRYFQGKSGEPDAVNIGDDVPKSPNRLYNISWPIARQEFIRCVVIMNVPSIAIIGRLLARNIERRPGWPA